MTFRQRKKIGVLVCAILVGLFAFAPIRHGLTRSDLIRVAHETVVAIDGRSLASVFDGSRADSKNLSHLSERPVQIPSQCKPTMSLKRIAAWLEPAVLAQAPCPATPCTGSRYVYAEGPCPQPACSGTWVQAYYHPGALPEWGAQNDGTSGCKSSPGYQCTTNLCNFVRCPLPILCGTNHNLCPGGQRCWGGVCQDYTCPDGSNKCRQWDDCLLTGGSCGPDACCELTPCYAMTINPAVWVGGAPITTASCTGAAQSSPAMWIMTVRTAIMCALPRAGAAAARI